MNEIYVNEDQLYEVAPNRKQDFLSKFPNAKLQKEEEEEEVKTPTTTSGADVVEEIAPDTDSTLASGSSGLYDRKSMTGSNTYYDKLEKEKTKQTKENKKKAKEAYVTLQDRLLNISQEQVDEQFINDYFKLDQRPVVTTTKSTGILPGQVEYENNPMPIKEYLSPEKFAEYEQALAGEPIIGSDSDEQAEIAETKTEARNNVRKKIQEQYLGSLSTDIKEVIENDKDFDYSFIGAEAFVKDTKSKTKQIELDRNKNIEKYNSEIESYNTQFDNIQSQLDVLIKNSNGGVLTVDKAGNPNATPATVIEYNKLIGEAQILQDQYKNSELDLLYDGVVAQGELINFNVDQINNKIQEVKDQSLLEASLKKDYTFSAAAGRAMEEFFAGSAVNFASLTAQLGLQSLKIGNVPTSLNTALKTLGVDFSLNDLNQEKVNNAISYVKKQTFDYNKYLREKREKNIPDAPTLDDIKSQDVTFANWFTRAFADNSPSMLVSFIPGGTGLATAAATRTAVGYAAKKAALQSQKNFMQASMRTVQGTFFTAETGSKFKEIEESPTSNNYTLSQKAFNSISSGLTAMYAETLGQTQMLAQGRKFIKNYGTRKFKKEAYDNINGFTKNVGVKLGLSTSGVILKGAGINTAEESLTLLGQNALDIVVLGEDKSILEGLNKDFFAQQLVASFGLSAPQALGGTMNILKNEFITRDEVIKNQGYVKDLVKVDEQLNNYKGDKRSSEYRGFKNKKNEIITKLAIADSEVLQKLNSLSIDQIEKVADLKRQMRLINSEAQRLGQSGLSGKDVNEARARLETQYRALDKQYNSILNTKNKDMAAFEAVTAEKLGEGFVNTNAAYYFGLFNFQKDAALTMSSKNSQMLAIEDDTKTTDESLEDYTLQQKLKILQGRDDGENATFIFNPKTKTYDIILYEDNIRSGIAATTIMADAKFSAGSALHELAHIRNIEKSIVNKNGELSAEGKEAVNEMINVLKENKKLGRLNITEADYNAIIRRFEAVKNSKAGQEEVMIALSDAALLGMIDINDIKNYMPKSNDFVKNLINKLLGDNGYLAQINTPEDVFNYVKQYQKDIIARKVVMDTEPDEEQNVVDNELGFSRSTLFETIQKLVPSNIKNKEEYNKFVRSPDGVELFNSIILPDGAIQRYVRDNQTSQEQGSKTLENIQDRILNFDPQAKRKTDGKAVGIEAFTERVMSDAMFGKMDANLALAKESEKASREKSIDDPEANNQLADDVNIDSKIDNIPVQRTSTLRRDLGIKQGDDLYNAVKQTAKEIFGKDLDNVELKKLKAIVNKKARGSELFKDIAKLMGTEKAIDPQFLNKNILNILKDLPVSDLVKLERGTKGEKIFTKTGPRLGPIAAREAVNEGLLPKNTNINSGPRVSEKLPVTLEQAKEFFTQKRKAGLVGVIAENLVADAAPSVTKEIKTPPKRRAEVLDVIDRDPELKFSRGVKRAISSIPISQQPEVIDKIGIFAQYVKKGFSVDTAINQVYGFLNPKPKELFAKLIKPELNKIIVNQKDLETGKPKEIDIVKFLTDAVDEITQKEVVKKTLGLGSGSLNFKNKEQLYGYFNLINQFIDSKIKNMDNDFDKAFYIVNTFAPTLTAAAKVSDGSLTWGTLYDLPILVNKKTGKNKESLRYSLFANNGQMGKVLIKPFLKNPELLVFKNSQLLYNGKKLFNTRASQTVSPALTSIKKNGKLSDDLLNKYKAYGEQNTNAVIELATFFKKLKDTDAGLSINDFGMFLQGANGDMSAMIRAAARLDSVAGLNDNLSLDPEKWRFEHNPPARTMQVHLANYIQGNINEDQLRKEFDNYTVSIIPKLMDDVINERYQDTSPLNATSKWERYYNEYSFGRFPYVTTVYKPTKDGKYTTEEFGKFAPAAYKSVQSAEVKNKKELAPVFKFSKSTPVDNQQVLDKMAEVDNINKEKALKFSKGTDLSKQFNDIIENKTGIGTDKRYAKVKARVAGAGKGKFNFFVPPSAEDFVGLLYATLGKGKTGDAQMAWYKVNLLDPYARAMNDLNRDRLTLLNDYKALKKDLKIVPKNLRKKIPGEPFTREQAVRVYIWDQQGISIPGLSQTDLKELTKYVNDNADLKIFGDQLLGINKGDPYNAPKNEGWTAGDISSDLLEGLRTTKRTKYLELWQQNVDQIFSETNLNKLEAAFGEGYRGALENMLYRMKTGRNRTFGKDGLMNRATDWLTNSVGAIMFFNTRSAILQTISSINFINWSDNNILAAGKALANIPQYKKDFVKLMNSPFLLARRDGLKMNVNEADIADMAKDPGSMARRFIAKTLRLGFLPTQIADSFAIASGGATFYRNRIKKYMKEGMNQQAAEKQAMIDFTEIAETSQQSSRPDKISEQQAGGLGRVILAFANTPMQYTREIKKAASDLKNGRGDAKTNISKIIYYGFVQNLIFNALQQALFALMFDDEEELTKKELEKKETKDQKRYLRILNSMSDQFLRGIGVGGAIVSTLKNTTIKLLEKSKEKEPEYAKNAIIELAQVSPPLGSKFRKLNNAGNAFEWNKDEMKATGWSLDNPAYLAGANVISAMTNLPADRVVKKIDNLRNASNTDLQTYKRIASFGGWSRWDLDIPAPELPKGETKKRGRKRRRKGSGGTF